MGKKVTIQQIADYLGVSKYVVSRALAGKSGVKEETREKVLNTAKQLGYKTEDIIFPTETNTVNNIQHDRSAQKNVLVVLPRSYYQDSVYWGKIIDGISLELNDLSRGMVIMTETDNFTTVINPQGFIGIICVGKLSTTILLEFKKWKIPVVLIDSEEPLFTTDTIFANNYDSSYLLTNYLIGLGHKKMQFIGNYHFSRSFYDRWLGFRSALELHNITEQSNEQVTLHNGLEFEDMYANIKAWIEKEVEDGNELPTAFVCANDLIALYVIDLLKALSFNIPEDISVTGFDNLENSYLRSPTLTTIHVPKEQLGRRAVKSLSNKIKNGKDQHEKVLLTCEMIVRESTAKPKENSV
ncbi:MULTISPECIES: LacI family DNA-binding transcriptional regulator [Metabacillus]|jgi:LacI family transcriptional regulator|uniref:HTH lacI-type domain-containing protein n=2 Tax=Metabacillus TaxID=2675233 RepID=A0A179T382_9BACI|nr:MULTISPECIES: LacI family DNA-binding transcriptional regulator [Metabacillus]OAS88556.1 hypothetical protein A6K24_16020 [Metabacillus litoralis]QNF30441.1 LacI family DNA-binding transcriptional regulator [Metabacillus sp. KUDC1714]